MTPDVLMDYDEMIDADYLSWMGYTLFNRVDYIWIDNRRVFIS